MGRLERRQDPFGPRRGLHRRDGFAVGGRGDLDPAALGQRGELRADARVIEPGRRGVRLDHLAVARPGASASAIRGGSPACRRGSPPHAGPVSMPSPAASTTASRTAGSPMNRASSPIAFDPPPTQASARSGSRPSTANELRSRLVADPALQVADDRRVRVRTHRRAEDVVGRLDVRDPVAHRLVDRVLERGRARRHAAHLGAERAHPQDVGALALDVLGAHVDDARQVEQRAGGGGRDAVLAGAGLGDDAGLAEPARQQRLAERVVDLVGAGVGEVLALEVEAEAGDRGRAGAAVGRACESRRLDADGLGQAVGAVERRSVGRRTCRAARAAPPRRRGRGGGRRRRVSSCSSAAISVSGT